MGNTNLQQTQFQQYWIEDKDADVLQHIPGTPKIIYSVYGDGGGGGGEIGGQDYTGIHGRPTKIPAQSYTLQITSSTQQHEISIYKQRKISHKNIVGIYDFYTSKNILGCTRSALCYNVITERIQYRLEEFKGNGGVGGGGIGNGNGRGLTGVEMIYVFHQALCGYEYIGKYGRICYANAMKIGVKANGEVRVWLNENWANNYYLKSRSQRSSIQTLWNTIKLCGDSSQQIITKCNDKLYQLGIQPPLNNNRRKQYGFEEAVELMRNQFGKEIIQGRFRFLRRVKERVKGQMEGNREKEKEEEEEERLYSSSPVVGGRPRAYSEQLRKREDMETDQYNSGSRIVEYRQTNPQSQKPKPKSSYQYRQTSNQPNQDPNNIFPKNRPHPHFHQPSPSLHSYTQPTQRSLTCTKPQSSTSYQQYHQYQQYQQQGWVIWGKGQGQGQGIGQGDGVRDGSSKRSSPGQGRKEFNPPSPQIVKNIHITHSPYQQPLNPQSKPQSQQSQQSTPTKQPKPLSQPLQSHPLSHPQPHHLQSPPPLQSPNYYNILIQNKIANQLSKKTGDIVGGNLGGNVGDKAGKGGNIGNIGKSADRNLGNGGDGLAIGAKDGSKRVNFSYKNSEFGVGDLNKIIDQKYNPTIPHKTQPNQPQPQPHHHSQPNTQPHTTTTIPLPSIPTIPTNPIIQSIPPHPSTHPSTHHTNHPPSHKQQLYRYTKPRVVIRPVENQQYLEKELEVEFGEELLGHVPVTNVNGYGQLEQSPIGKYPEIEEIDEINPHQNYNYNKPIHQTNPNLIITLNTHHPSNLHQHHSLTQRHPAPQIPPLSIPSTMPNHKPNTTRETHERSKSVYREMEDQKVRYRRDRDMDRDIDRDREYQWGRSQERNGGQNEGYNGYDANQASYRSPERKNNGDFMNETGEDSRKVAQQFKYYLRSVQRSPDPKQPQQHLTLQQHLLQQQQQQLLQQQQQEQDSYEQLSNSRRNKYVCESNAPAIPERWDEEESLSQNF